MSKFDVEKFYDYAVALLKDNIGNKITELNTEKSDSITLEAPENEEYIADFNSQAVLPEFFVYYTISDVVPVQSVGEAVALEVTLMIYAAFIDYEEGDAPIRKGMRYVRALYEIFSDNFAKNSRISDFEIFQHMPQSAQFENTENWYKIAGVQIKGTIAP